MKMEATSTITVLQDLLKANNDRAEGYRKAADETNELDLKTVLLSMGDESKKNTAQLLREIKKLGGDADPAITSATGKMYRVWMDLKSTLTGRDRNTILNSCEFGEDAAQNAYKQAIASNDLSTDVRQMVRNQQVALRASHDWVRNYRDRGNMGFVKS